MTTEATARQQKRTTTDVEAGKAQLNDLLESNQRLAERVNQLDPQFFQSAFIPLTKLRVDTVTDVLLDAFAGDDADKVRLVLELEYAHRYKRELEAVEEHLKKPKLIVPQ